MKPECFWNKAMPVAHLVSRSGPTECPSGGDDALIFTSYCGEWLTNYALTGMSLPEFGTSEQATAAGKPLCNACLDLRAKAGLRMDKGEHAP